MKTCRACGLAKPLAEFYRNDPMPDGHLNQCKACVNERVKAYSASDPARTRRWSAARQVRYRRRHREMILRKLREWRARNPEKVAANHALRYSRRWTTSSSFTAAEFREKCSLLGNVCFYCGESRKLGPDHKLPLARGGSNDITNIVPACVSCNHHKSTRTAQEYIAVRMSA